MIASQKPTTDRDKQYSVSVKVTLDEKSDILAHVKTQGLSVSEYLRTRIFSRVSPDRSPVAEAAREVIVTCHKLRDVHRRTSMPEPAEISRLVDLVIDLVGIVRTSS